jgi:hypothetical protein
MMWPARIGAPKGASLCSRRHRNSEPLKLSIKLEIWSHKDRVKVLAAAQSAGRSTQLHPSVNSAQSAIQMGALRDTKGARLSLLRVVCGWLTASSFATSRQNCRSRALTCSQDFPSKAATWHTIRSGRWTLADSLPRSGPSGALEDLQAKERG